MKKLTEIRCNLSEIQLPQIGVMKLVVCDFFLRKLNQTYSFNKSYILSINSTEDPDTHLELNYTKEESLLEIYYYVEKSSKEREYTWEEMFVNITKIITISLGGLANFINIDLDKLKQIENEFILTRFVSQYYFRSAHLKSPDKKHSINIKNVFRYDGFESWLILYDSQKLIIAENLIYVDSFDCFKIEFLKWVDSNVIVFKFKGPEKEFFYTIEQLINHQTQIIPEKIHLYFK